VRIALIAEGPIDFEVSEILLSKVQIVSPTDPEPVRLPLRQLSLRRHLKALSGRQGNPLERVDKAIVLKDSGSLTCQQVVAGLQQQIGGANWPFPVKLGSAVREIESWLLADHQALSIVTGLSCNPVHNPEGIQDPKQVLRNILERASPRQDYGIDKAREIAEKMNLQIARPNCHSLDHFINSAHDC